LKRDATFLLVIILTAYAIGPQIVSVKSTGWGSPGALPGTDQYTNRFPRLLQASNGSIWLAWGKFVTTYGEIYLMVNNGFGWSGQIPLINSNGAFDDITPALTQLINGTIILAWSRGGPGGTGGCNTPNTYSIYTQSFTNGVWSNPTLTVGGPGDDLTPAMTRMNDGRVMMVWTRCTPTTGGGDLYYKIYNGTWGPESLLVGSTGFEEKLPSVASMNDGRAWVVYTSNTGSGNINQLWDMIWNGSTWTAPALFTNTTLDDDWPSITQDRNQTIWVFWARDVSNGTVGGIPTFQYDLYYKNSTSNGQTWSPEATIAPNINSNDVTPFVIQTNTKKLWMVYSSDQTQGNPYHAANLYLIISDIVKVHDLALNSIALPPSYPYRKVGDVVGVNVTVSDPGDYPESSQVNCYVNSTQVYSLPFSINPGQTEKLTVPWNTTGSIAGNYIVKASVVPVNGEFITTNNYSPNVSIPISFRGDLTRVGRVDVTDLAIIGAHFAAIVGSPNYYAPADPDNDGIINVSDLVIVGADFGKVLPIHRLSIGSLTLPKIRPRVGEIVKITANITDTGSYMESTQARLYLNSVLTSTVPINLIPGQTITVTFSWNSTGFNPARYPIMVGINPVANELLSTNTLNSSMIITFRGDVNRDGRVDISDLALIGSHFQATIGSPNYYPDADLNRDGIINVSDLAILGADFGKQIV
jgi:hypothetical protein